MGGGTPLTPPPPPPPLSRFAPSFWPPCWKILAMPVDKNPVSIKCFTPPLFFFPSVVWGVVHGTQHPPPESGDGIVISLWKKCVCVRTPTPPPPPPFLVTGWGVVHVHNTSIPSCDRWWNNFAQPLGELNCVCVTPPPPPPLPSTQLSEKSLSC